MIINVPDYLTRTSPEMIQALWCRHSETGEELLVDMKTSKVIAKRIDGKIVDPNDGEEEPC